MLPVFKTNRMSYVNSVFFSFLLWLKLTQVLFCVHYLCKTMYVEYVLSLWWIVGIAGICYSNSLWQNTRLGWKRELIKSKSGCVFIWFGCSSTSYVTVWTSLAEWPYSLYPLHYKTFLWNLQFIFIFHINPKIFSNFQTFSFELVFNKPNSFIPSCKVLCSF